VHYSMNLLIGPMIIIALFEEPVAFFVPELGLLCLRHYGDCILKSNEVHRFQ